MFTPSTEQTTCRSTDQSFDDFPGLQYVDQHRRHGSGPFNLPDPKVGLSDLSSYQATLTLSFDGTHDGRAEKWSRAHTTPLVQRTACRSAGLSRHGQAADTDPVFMAEAEGADYQRVGENVCSASSIEVGKLEQSEPVLLDPRDWGERCWQ